MKRTSIVASVAVAIALGACSAAQAVALVNPGFDAQDASGGDIYGSAGWFAFNDAFTSQKPFAFSAPNVMKIFGPFFHGGGAGVGQGGFAASEGQLWQASSYARIDTSDPMSPSNFAVVKLEFLNSSSSVIGFAESPQITTTSLLPDTWQKFTAQGVAPAGTASAQIILVHVQLDPIDGGSIFFDDAALGIIPEPASAGLALFGLMAIVGLRRRRA
jgi:MYXO-CTERM domain-containing protein